MPTLTRYLVNPRIEIDVVSDVRFTIKDLHIDFEIHKDLSEEPNECELTIYNLGPSTRAMLSNSLLQSTPIEVYLTPAGKAEKIATPLRIDMVKTFRGEIDDVRHRRARPGYETRIVATSQKENHRAFMFGPKTYAKGTPASLIIADLVLAVGLTPAIDPATLPATPILIAQTLSGPAFPLLQKFCYDVGLYAYINDGVCYVTSTYSPPRPNPKFLFRAYFLESPSLTTRLDEMDIEMRTIVEATTINPFAALRKKKNKRAKVVGANDYIEYQAVEKEIAGVDYTLLLQPDLNPDDLVTPVDYLELIGKIGRIREVSHYGDNHGGDWTTEALTDDLDAGLL